MVSALGYLVEIAGFCCVVTAAWMVAFPLGLATLGAALVIVAQAARR